jgi:hypothetical protein
MRSFPNLYVVFQVLFTGTQLYAQTKQGTPHHMNHNNVSVNLNYIYNFSAYRSELSNTYLTGTSPNYSGTDTVYYEKHRNTNASTLGLNIAWNKRLSKRTALAFGTGFNQKQQITKYSVYNDRNMQKPDLVYTIVKDYALVLNIGFNYYYQRFIFNAGNNFAYSIVQKSVNTYEDNSQKNNRSTTGPVNLYFQESVSYQLIRNKNLYLKVSAEQSEDFYKPYGYNNWFMLGGAYYF